MAEVEEVVKARLTAQVPLVSGRIYPGRLPQSPVYPAITYRRISGTREHGMTADHGLPHPRIQIDCWGATYASVTAVATQVRTALNRWADPGTDPPVLDVFLDNETDFDEDEVTSASTEPRRRMLDFIVWFRG